MPTTVSIPASETLRGRRPFSVLDAERPFFPECRECREAGVRVRGIATAVTCTKPKSDHFADPVAALVSRAMHDIAYGLFLDDPRGFALMGLTADEFPLWRDAVASGGWEYEGVVYVGGVAFAAMYPMRLPIASL